MIWPLHRATPPDAPGLRTGTGALSSGSGPSSKCWNTPAPDRPDTRDSRTSRLRACSGGRPASAGGITVSVPERLASPLEAATLRRCRLHEPRRTQANIRADRGSRSKSCRDIYASPDAGHATTGGGPPRRPRRGHGGGEGQEHAEPRLRHRSAPARRMSLGHAGAADRAGSAASTTSRIPAHSRQMSVMHSQCTASWSTWVSRKKIPYRVCGAPFPATPWPSW